MIGSLKESDKSGREKVRYFLNAYGKQVLELLIKRYKRDNMDQIDLFVEKDDSKIVLVICPFCGVKTPHGLMRCKKCESDL